MGIAAQFIERRRHRIMMAVKAQDRGIDLLQILLPRLIHALAAIGAILVWIVHVYAALWVEGTVRAMMRGTVSGGWAWRHHRRWLREEVGRTKTPS